MAQCDVQSLLDDAKCFYALNPQMLAVAQAQLWCNISGAITPGGGGNVINGELVLFNEDDGFWYASARDVDLLLPPVVTATPVPAPPHTVTIPSDDDSTTHVVGVANDPLGNVVLYVVQEDAGTPGEVIMMGPYQLKANLNPSGEYNATLV